MTCQHEDSSTEYLHYRSVNDLTEHGLDMTRLNKPQPLEEETRFMPILQRHYGVPQLIVIEVTRVDG